VPPSRVYDEKKREGAKKADEIKALAASATEKSSLFRAVIHPRIINQFREAVITVCFRAIARTVSAGKRRECGRRRGRKKIE